MNVADLRMHALPLPGHLLKLPRPKQGLFRAQVNAELIMPECHPIRPSHRFDYLILGLLVYVSINRFKQATTKYEFHGPDASCETHWMVTFPRDATIGSSPERIAEQYGTV